MMIKSLTARFGCLDGRRLELRRGLNVITLPNEGGKSTWCAFIPAMLYGVDSRERARRGTTPGKIRYQPWSGGVMEGEMLAECDGREIRLIRRTADPAHPMRGFSAAYVSSGEPVSGLTSQTAGETLTGASREVFLASALISHADMRPAASPGLERKISAIVTAGDEQSTLSEAEERLTAWERRRLYRRSGAIAEAEAGLAEKRRESQESLELEQRLGELEAELKDALSRKASRQSDAEKRENERRRELYSELQRVKEQLSELGEAEKPRKKPGGSRLALIAAAVLLLSAVLLGFWGRPLPAALSGLCAALCAAAGAMGLKRRRRADASDAGKNELEAQLRAELEGLERELLISQSPSEPPDGGEADALRCEIAEVKAAIAALGGRDGLQSEIDALEERLAVLKRDYAAIELALGELRCAGEELASRFSPALCKLASGYFSRITGGKYDALSFDRALCASAHEKGGAVPREAELLSSGTLDAVYFSLRLALCELTLAPDCPIIFDDALLCFDDERASNAMELIFELSRRRQIILFTCHTRERLWLRNRIERNEI